MFPGGSSGTTYNPGELLRDSVAQDLLSGSGTDDRVGTPTATAEIGTNQLKDTGEFANDDLRGAIGMIVASDGRSQIFQVTKVVDKDTLEIALISDEDGIVDGQGTKSGWKTALATTSTYRLYFPGRVQKGIDPTQENHRIIPRGVMQSKAVVPANKFRYGWALQEGIGVGKLDVSVAEEAAANSVKIGTPVVPSGSGLLKGMLLPTDANGTYDDLGDVSNDMRHAIKAVGMSVLGPLNVTSSSDDRLQAFYFDIRNKALSYRFPIKDEPYSTDDQGNLVL